MGRCSQCGKHQNVLTRVGISDAGEYIDLCDSCAAIFKDDWEKKKRPVAKQRVGTMRCAKCGNWTFSVDKTTGLCNKCFEEQKNA